jgi:hypothetical protein
MPVIWVLFAILMTLSIIALIYAAIAYERTNEISHDFKHFVNHETEEEEDREENDLNALRYAVTLENLENAFYRTGLETFTQTDFANAGYNASVYNYVVLIASHENAHVSFLNNALTSAGADPIPECTYNFNLSTVEDFIQKAATFENVGVQAYDGALNTLSSDAYVQAAATIATVEARHAAYLNQLIGESPFPDNFDPTLTPQQVVDVISPYLVVCPYSLILPVPEDSLESPESLPISDSGHNTAKISLSMISIAVVYLVTNDGRP